MDEDIRRSKQYSALKIWMAIVQFVLTVACLAIMLVSGTSALLKNLVAGWTGSFYLQVGLYVAILSGIFRLLFLPLDFCESFLLEHKFGLSTQTVLGWAFKGLKKAVVSLPLLLFAGEAFYFLLRFFPDYWWLLITAIWLLTTIVLSKIAPVLIIPLFYKCKPLPDSDLQNKLLELGQRCGVSIRDVFEIRLSKETKKANAVVAGFGNGRRILLGDTLLKNYSADEIEAVFAHELGHIRLFHTWKILGFSTTVAMVCLYLTSLLFTRIVNQLGFDHIHDIAAFPLLLLCLLLMGFALMPIQNGYSRHLEKQADMFALGRIADNCSLTSALAKLGIQNLSDPSPNRLVELFLYDHPPVGKRVAYCHRKDEK